MWVTPRHATAFLKSVKQKSNFSQTLEWKEILRRKTNKSFDKTAVWNDSGINTKRIVNLILENAMPKAIIEVYFELLVSNFYAQTSCSCHSNFVKIVSILMHHIAITVFVYISFLALNKMIWLVTCSTNSGQKVAQLNFVQRLQIANQKCYYNFDTRCARHDFYQSSVWRLCACVVQMSCK